MTHKQDHVLFEHAGLIRLYFIVIKMVNCGNLYRYLMSWLPIWRVSVLSEQDSVSGLRVVVQANIDILRWTQSLVSIPSHPHQNSSQSSAILKSINVIPFDKLCTNLGPLQTS